MKAQYLLLLLGIFAVFAGPAAAMKVQADMGETWIRWSWSDNTTAAIYVDGLFVSNSSLPYYYLSGAKANSEHRLELRNASANATMELLARSTVRTSPPAGTVQLILAISFIFVIVVVFSQDEVKKVVSGLMGIVIASYGRSISYNYYGIDWIFLAFIFATIYIVGTVVLAWIREKLQWW